MYEGFYCSPSGTQRLEMGGLDFGPQNVFKSGVESRIRIIKLERRKKLWVEKRMSRVHLTFD
jgi:hypothetical protein